MKGLLLLCPLLVALLFPGLPAAKDANHGHAEGPRAPTEEVPRQGANRSSMFRNQVKHDHLSRSPPLEDLALDFKVVNCRKSEGRCQEYCNYMETQVGYCPRKKEACCLRHA